MRKMNEKAPKHLQTNQYSAGEKGGKKAYIASTIVLGGTLYGAEVDHLTTNNLYKIRQVLGSAIWGNRGPRNKIAGLLLHKQRQIEPFVKRATQLVGHGKGCDRKDIWKAPTLRSIGKSQETHRNNKRTDTPFCKTPERNWHRGGRTP